MIVVYGYAIIFLQLECFACERDVILFGLIHGNNHECIQFQKSCLLVALHVIICILVIKFVSIVISYPFAVEKSVKYTPPPPFLSIANGAILLFILLGFGTLDRHFWLVKKTIILKMLHHYLQKNLHAYFARFTKFGCHSLDCSLLFLRCHKDALYR